MAGIGRLSVIALDTAEPHRLAGFYAALTGWPVQPGDDDWVELDSGGGVTLAFQLAPDHRPPVWPSADHPQQAHVDVDVDDLDAAEEQVLALGATKASVQPGTTFRVYLDPSGHPFCLVRSS